MKKVLRVDSSLFDAYGNSSVLAEEIQNTLLGQFPELEVEHLSFAQQPVPHVDAAHIQALMAAEAERTAEQAEKVAYSDGLIEQVKQADAIILTAPMYNFQVPSMLKAWIDQLARAGVTFKYTETGPVGLLADKPVFVVTTRGGLHKGQPYDTVETFLTSVLAFMGLTQVHFIYAEGLNMGDEAKAQGLAGAKTTIQSLITETVAA